MPKTNSPFHDDGPGHLLEELERRQDDVIAQLDDLDAQLEEVLRGLEPASDEDAETETVQIEAGKATLSNAAASEPNKTAASDDLSATPETPVSDVAVDDGMSDADYFA
ncbi:MAG: hypothetical protein AAFX06_06910 [Planctomycetota bacterium]